MKVLDLTDSSLDNDTLGDFITLRAFPRLKVLKLDQTLVDSSVILGNLLTTLGKSSLLQAECGNRIQTFLASVPRDQESLGLGLERVTFRQPNGKTALLLFSPFKPQCCSTLSKPD